MKEYLNRIKIPATDHINGGIVIYLKGRDYSAVIGRLVNMGKLNQDTNFVPNPSINGSTQKWRYSGIRRKHYRLPLKPRNGENFPKYDYKYTNHVSIHQHT